MDIPGYKIQREIGIGGSSRVYLAVQRTFGSAVAIKVLSPEAGQAARQSFLAEGELARGLDHPNIVRVLDVGEADSTAYHVMEYVRGGDLNRNLRDGLHMQNVLAVVKEIAAALGYAHGKGVVHADVKPENILINEQGTSLLSDFGIATQAGVAGTTGKVRGTPGYMSPEQAAGQPIDARSDIYSLGVVLYLMLTGRPPFDRERRRGIRPPPGPPPTLPLQLAAFEPAIQRMLARSPEDRFGSALEISGALDQVRAGGLVPNAVVKTDAISTAEIVAAAARSERPGGAADVARHSGLRRAGAAATVLGVLSLAGAAAFLGNESGALERALAAVGWIENPDAVVAWRTADELRGDPNQSLETVVDAYRDVLAIDPRRVDAQAQIDELARQWKEDIGRLIDEGDLDTARGKLADLADAFADDPDLTGLSDRLGDRRQSVALLEQNIRLLEGSGLADVRAVDSAIVGLKEVLALHPGNPDAQAALDGVAIYYAQVATDHAREGDGPSALDAVLRAERANPAFDGVEEVKATVTTAVAEHHAAQEQFQDMLQQAAELREAGSLVDAIRMYRSALVIEPDAAVALQGFAGTTSDVLAEFQILLDNDRWDEATRLLELATNAGIADDAVEEMRGLRDAQLKRIADVARFIDEAESFMQEGYVTGPDPENSAVARLRDALRLDADNADGIRLQSLAATRLAEVAEEAYYAGMVEEGLEYLDLALTVTPGITRWQERREQWQAERRERGTGSEDAGLGGG